MFKWFLTIFTLGAPENQLVSIKPNRVIHTDQTIKDFFKNCFLTWRQTGSTEDYLNNFPYNITLQAQTIRGAVRIKTTITVP